MRVAVGSTNPVKRRAVADALGGDVAVSAVDVDSGVSEQPRGHGETVAGAENRARRALEAAARSSDAGCDYGVGIEGGVAAFDRAGAGTPWVDPAQQAEAAAADGPGESEGALFLVMWAAVTDGTGLARAAGPSLPLPERLTKRVSAGEELGPVLDDVLGTTGLAEREGAAGVLTDGVLTRESALAGAVAGAFAPFRVALYD